jgi:hypothetical protein
MNRKVHSFIVDFMIIMISLIFILFYPMLISIYVFLPLLIGIMGYTLIRGIEKNSILYLLISLLYLVNLDLNLSLPLFLSILSSLLVYVLIYPYFRHLKRCKICKPILSVMFIDLFYLGILLFYDFMFQTHSIVLDDLLYYSPVVDLLLAVIL